MKHHIITNVPESAWNDREVVHVVDFDFESVSEITAIRKWCHETYGSPGLRPDTMYTRWRDMSVIGRIYFAHEEDVSLFLLKWT